MKINLESANIPIPPNIVEVIGAKEAEKVSKLTLKNVETGTDWGILKKLAEISPKSYAPKIRRRNKWGLKCLEENAWTYSTLTKELGCPHCKGFDCCECLWRKVGAPSSSFGYYCCGVEFGGRTLTLVNRGPFGVEYSEGDITIINHDVQNYELTLALKQYIVARSFLIAHIVWTHNFKWASKRHKRK